MANQREPLYVQVDYDVYNMMVDLIVNEVSMPYVKAQSLVRQIEKGSKAVFPPDQELPNPTNPHPERPKKKHEPVFDEALIETEVEG